MDLDGKGGLSSCKTDFDFAMASEVDIALREVGRLFFDRLSQRPAGPVRGTFCNFPSYFVHIILGNSIAGGALDGEWQTPEWRPGTLCADLWWWKTTGSTLAKKRSRGLQKQPL